MFSLLTCHSFFCHLFCYNTSALCSLFPLLHLFLVVYVPEDDGPAVMAWGWLDCRSIRPANCHFRYSCCRSVRPANWCFRCTGRWATTVMWVGSSVGSQAWHRLFLLKLCSTTWSMETPTILGTPHPILSQYHSWVPTGSLLCSKSPAMLMSPDRSICVLSLPFYCTSKLVWNRFKTLFKMFLVLMRTLHNGF